MLPSLSLAAQEETPAEESQDLFRETLPADIRTASFYELVDWASRLGLSTRGDRSALQQRIADYYEVSLDTEEPAGEADGEEGAREVVIESATESEYFSLDSIDEEYVRLRGGVRLRTRAEGEEAVHFIEAEEIVFNRARNSLTASGRVRYRIDRAGEIEEFSGETLSFELDSWEGQFIQGVSSRDREVEGEQIRFRYSGEYMTRTADDIVVMDDGVITSSRADPPYYSIRARRIWVYGGGEWAIRGARLYVGRVPIIAFPFFFKPGDELFFNPVVGSRSREGAFIQTTSYLLGEQETQDSAISFLQVADDQPAGPRRREGLFLTSAQTGAGSAPEEETGDPGTVKLLLDLYTRLGAYAGLEAELSDLGAITSLDGSLGIAASRHLYPADSGVLTPYRIVDDSTSQDWNSTNFLGLRLPFRYLVDLSARARESWFSGTAGLELYSDPFVTLDFGDRAEDMDWLGLLSQDETTGEGGGVEKRRLRWDSSLRVNPRLQSLAPYLQSLSVRELGASLNWQNREIEDPPPEIAEADRSPEGSFFYPVRSVFPSLGLSVGGRLLQWPGAAERESPTSATGGGERIDAEFRSPWAREAQRERAADTPDTGEKGETAAEASGGGEEEYRPPVVREAGVSFSYPQLFSGSLGYSLNSTTTVENSYNDDAWLSPEEVDFQLAYSSFTTSNTARLQYGGSLMERILSLDGSLEAAGRYRSIYNEEALEAEEAEVISREAARYSSFSLANALTARVLPLPARSPFGDSRISYDLNTDLFRLVYDDEASESLAPADAVYREQRIRWNEEFVTGHSLAGTVRLQALGARQAVSLTTTLPPLTTRYQGGLDTAFGPWEASARVSAEEPGSSESAEGPLVFEPLSFRQAIRFLEEGSLRQSLRYDIEQEQMDRFGLDLSGRFGSAQFVMRRTPGVRFESDFVQAGLSSPWVESGDERLRAAEARLAAEYSLEPLPLWKNRITFSTGTSLGIEANLQRFTESSLNLEARLNLTVHEFLDLSFRSSSENNFIYQYVPALAAEVGRTPRNPLLDLAQSFNFFRREDRVRSFFNLQTLSLEATHRLGDWDLLVSYSGRPTLSEDTSPPSYEWDTEFSVLVQWRPLPEMKSDVTYADDELQYETGQR